jgi:transcriptional regulator with GAF, ATPase, and Fis domain
MAGEKESEEIATKLAHMARDLLAQNSLQQTLDRIVKYSVELVHGCDMAGIMVVHRGHVVTLAASDEQARVSDRIQGEVREGPCFDAVRTGTESYLIQDMQADVARWPRYGPHARELGIGGMLGFKLFTDEGTLGALNMYSRRPHMLTERSEQVGWLLASHAAVAFASARSDADLHLAVESRQDIGMALGILIERYKLTPAEAFARLSQSSQDHNVKLRKLARQIVETGETPGIA